VNRQNEELKKWNSELELYVQQQTLDIQKKNNDLEKLNEQLRSKFKKSIEVFSNLIEMRDKSMSNHAKNVAMLSRQIAVGLQLGPVETNNLLVAALLHDIGKIGVSDAVLMKDPRSWNDVDTMEYRSHPVRGQVAVDILDGFHDIGLTIRHHHENVDGTGFPDGLKKNAIPLGSRIIAVVDAFDRIASMTISSAEILQKTMETLEFSVDIRYDRQVLTCFRTIVEDRIRAMAKQGTVSEEETELQPTLLQPGMILSRDIRSGTGILVLARGNVLDQQFIKAIQRFYQIDAPRNGIYVRKQAPRY